LQIHDNPKDLEKQQIFNFEEVKKVIFNFAIDCGVIFRRTKFSWTNKFLSFYLQMIFPKKLYQNSVLKSFIFCSLALFIIPLILN
jgi:hypothetical protein